MFFTNFNVNKFKPNLKMAVNRIAIIKSKKSNVITNAKAEVADLLLSGKEEKARIRVEGIIREDFTIEGLEILELLCDLLAERASLIKAEKECPYDMREAVCTVIYAATRCEVPELLEVKKQLVKKYGKDFEVAAVANIDGCVNERVISRLSVTPPSAYLVLNYMKKIADEHRVEWNIPETEKVDPLEPIAAPTGTSVNAAEGSGKDYRALYAANPPSLGAPPSLLPSIPTASVEETFGDKEEEETPGELLESTASVPGFDELSDRFDKLRRKEK